MVEQVVIICQAYFYTFLYTGLRLFFLFFFLNLSWIGQLLPVESCLSLKKGNVWSVSSTNDQPIAQRCISWTMNWQVYSWSTTQCYSKLSENLWPNRQERQELYDDCTVIPTAMHVQFSPRRFSYVHISSNDMVCQQITVQTVKA